MEKRPVDRVDVITDESELNDKIAPAPSHQDIAALAYALWEERGRGDGGAERDWLEAERQLQPVRHKVQAA